MTFLRDHWPVAFTASPHYTTQEATPSRLFDYLRALRYRFSDPSPCSSRRAMRFPFSLRLLCWKFETCSPHDKAYWSARLWQAKVNWHRELNIRRLRADIDRGKAVSKAKKLFKIKSIRFPGRESLCHDDSIVSSLGKHFSAKYGSGNLQLREAVSDWVRASEFSCPDFDEIVVESVLSRCKAPRRLDEYGMCFELFRVAFEARPDEFTSWLQFVCSTELLMRSLASPVRCFGKKSTHTSAGDVRAIVPPCSLLVLLDAILARCLTDRLFPKQPGVIVGGRRFT